MLAVSGAGDTRGAYVNCIAGWSSTDTHEFGLLASVTVRLR
jgi:hypothetical protein